MKKGTSTSSIPKAKLKSSLATAQEPAPYAPIPSPLEQAKATGKWVEGQGLTEPPTTRPIVEKHFKHCHKRNIRVSHIPCKTCGACTGNARVLETVFKANSAGGWGPIGDPTDGRANPKLRFGENISDTSAAQAIAEARSREPEPTPKVDPDTGLLVHVPNAGSIPPTIRKSPYGPPETVFNLEAPVDVGGKTMTKRERVMQLIRLGNVLTTAFRAVGVKAQTFYIWCDRAEAERKWWRAQEESERPDRPPGHYARLMDDVDQACADAETRYLNIIAEGALKQKQIGTAMWRLERMNNAFRGGQVIAHEGGDPTRPIQTNSQVDANVQQSAISFDVGALLAAKPELLDSIMALAAAAEEVQGREVREVREVPSGTGSPPVLPERNPLQGEVRSTVEGRSYVLRRRVDEGGEGTE